MEKRILFLLFVMVCVPVWSQRDKTDANIVGHVKYGSDHLPFVNISVKGTTIGTQTDATGHYQLVNVPVGELTIVASFVGFRTIEKTIATERGVTKELHFELEEDVFKLDEIVISADKNEQKRSEAPVIINTLSPKLFSSTESVTLSEGLKFCPGLRMENNCENCGFNQVRMNGMEGPYSQILINNRPVFSGLAGVYGLELIPANMLERVEVIRGGGSSIFGSNAIAGTINLILKEPEGNSFEAGINNGLMGVGMQGTDPAQDFSVNLNTSVVTDDKKSGFALYGFSRVRKAFDANSDGFSELALMKNTTIGARGFHRFGYRNKLTADFFVINEERAGGNRFDYPMHERDIAEAVRHDMKNISLTYEQYFRDFDLLTVYASGQFLDRESYYGANRIMTGYGMTKDRTYNVGAHYKFRFPSSSLICGIENTSGFLYDTKNGYPDYANAVISGDSLISIPHVDNAVVADQALITSGLFSQYDQNIGRIKISLGARYDHYQLHNFADGAKKTGTVFSPRISLMYNRSEQMKFRISYSQGYRAPQIFDEDLHIHTSGSRRILHVNDPNLKQETSNSIMVSSDMNRTIGRVKAMLLIEGFYTRLKNSFYKSIGTPDSSGTVVYTRTNASQGAHVAGVNIELRLIPSRKVSIISGFTIQQSRYEAPQDFNERDFFRTPSTYGFLIADVFLVKNITISATGNYTGKMLIPYFGPLTDPDIGELRLSQHFFDLGLKVGYTYKINGISMNVSAGIKNMLNAYQRDFDSGIGRDPAYVYGPVLPRMIFVGVKIGNLL